jgi:transcriptional regulator with XRE-family HTH domain
MSRHATRQVSRSGFALRLHEALAGTTTEEFARQVGVTLRTATRWRNGESEPSGADLVRIAAATGRDAAWFYADHDEAPAAS